MFLEPEKRSEKDIKKIKKYLQSKCPDKFKGKDEIFFTQINFNCRAVFFNGDITLNSSVMRIVYEGKYWN